jgi:hypothetical protein
MTAGLIRICKEVQTVREGINEDKMSKNKMSTKGNLRFVNLFNPEGLDCWLFRNVGSYLTKIHYHASHTAVNVMNNLLSIMD